MSRPVLRSIPAFVLAALALCALAVAQTPEWQIVKPSTTGVPGEEVRVMAFDPQGNLWIAARWAFWEECGLAMLPAAELPYSPLPGGGFDTGAWTVWSNVDHPLPSPYIDDIEFAPDGTIWLASEGGLTRFRPTASTPEEMWHTYNAANSPLILDAVASLDMDSHGLLWLTNVSVQFSSGALFSFRPATEQWTQYTVGQELPWYAPWYNVDSVMVGSDDHIWLTHSVLGGLAEFNGTSWVLHTGGTQFGGLMEDLQGNIWLRAGSSGSGLWKWNGTSYQSWSTIGGTGTMTGLGMGLDGTVYVSTWYGGVYRMVGGTTPVFFVNAADIPRDLFQRPDGDIWISNYGGNGTVGTVRHYTSDGALLERFNSFNSGLPWYWIDRMTTDRDGFFWFATGEAGLSRFDGTRWRNWGNHNDLSEPYPFAGNEPMGIAYQDRHGLHWFGGNGIARWNSATGEFTGFWNWENNPGMGGGMWIAFAEDASGRLFSADHYNFLYHLDTASDMWVLEPLQPYAPLGLPGMEADSQGNVWVAAWFDLHKWDGASWSTVTLPYPGYLFDLGGVNCLDIGSDDVIWLGTNEGLVRWDGSAFTLYDTANSPLPAQEVQGIAIRGDGLMALSAIEFGSVTPFPNGVAVIDGDIANPANWSVYSYGTSPLPHYQLGRVAFDAEGKLWVSAISEGTAVLRFPTTLSADLTCLPALGTVPFNTLMTVALGNTYSGQSRRFAARIDVTTGDGSQFTGWRSGYTNVLPSQVFTTAWSQVIPALGTVIGQNVFSLAAEDVTPPPFNQPPYPPSGETDRAACTVTAAAP